MQASDPVSLDRIRGRLEAVALERLLLLFEMLWLHILFGRLVGLQFALLVGQEGHRRHLCTAHFQHGDHLRRQLL